MLDGTRYNRNGLYLTHNASILYGTSSIDFYFYLNLYNNDINQFHNSIAFKTNPWNIGYNGNDGRSELLALLGVNHFITKAGDENTPVTFEIKEVKNERERRQNCVLDSGYKARYFLQIQ